MQDLDLNFRHTCDTKMRTVLRFYENHEVLFYSLILFVIRGATLTQGFAIDDYEFAFPNDDFFRLMSNGRFTQVLLFKASQYYQVSLADITPLAYLAGIISQAWFVATLRQLLNAAASWRTMLVATCILAHPYATEIFTFRAGLIGYAMSMFFLVASLRINSSGKGKLSCIGAGALLLLGLWSYQACLNYLLAICTFLVVQTILLAAGQEQNTASIIRSKVILLRRIAFSTGVALISFLCTMKPILRAYDVEACARSKHLRIDEIPPRFWAIMQATREHLWQSNILFSDQARKLLLLFFCLSFFCVIAQSVYVDSERWRKNVFIIGATFLVLTFALPLLALGVIVIFEDFWPVPRAIAHIAVVSFSIGFIVEARIKERLSNIWSVFVFSTLTPIAFLLSLSNLQIMAEQVKVNSWDRLRVNRLVARLEELPAFHSQMPISFVGGDYGYPHFRRTTYGDLNVSAFSLGVPKHAVVNAISGYRFAPASEQSKIEAEDICHTQFALREADIVLGVEGQAVVCLR